MLLALNSGSERLEYIIISFSIPIVRTTIKNVKWGGVLDLVEIARKESVKLQGSVSTEDDNFERWVLFGNGRAEQQIKELG
jgi:hypothetical protein